MGTPVLHAQVPPLQWLGGGHAGGVRSVNTASDGTVWSAGVDGTIKQWNALNMKLIRTSSLAQLGGAVFSSDGQRTLLITSGSSGVQLANLADGSLVRSYPSGGFGSVAAYRPAISANGQTIAYVQSNWSGDIFVFATASGPQYSFLATPFDPINGSYGAVPAVAASANGATVAAVFALGAGDTRNIRLFNVATGAQTRILSHNTTDVRALAFSADGNLLASSSADGKINVLRLSDLVVVRTISVFENGVPVSGNSLAFSPDGTMIAQGDSSAARIYNIASGASVARIAGNASSVAFTSDNQWLSVGTDRDVRLWTVASSAPLPSIAPHSGPITGVAYSPKGNLVASSSSDLTVKLWRTSDGAVVATLTGHSDRINAVAFSPDGDLVASGSKDRTIRVWRTSDYALVATLTGHTQSIQTLAFSPDGALLASGSASPEQAVKLWSVGGSGIGSQWSLSNTLTGTGGSVTSVQFSPDGQTLAGGDDGGIIRIWQTGTGAMVRTYLAPSQGPTSVAFSPDGQILAAGWLQNILVFQGGQISPLLNIPAHGKSGTVVAYAPDGQKLLSGNPDGTLKIWSTTSWSPLTTYTQETFASGSGITSVGYAPNNTRFVYGRGDATIGSVVNAATPLAISVTVNTSPPGLQVLVDGVAHPAPYTFVSAQGSSHTLSVATPQGTGTRQVFLNWSDGGAPTHTITPVASRIYNANFTTQYLLTQAVSPVGGGTITNVPASGDQYYNAGTTVQLTATPAFSYTFGSWIGSITSTNNPLTLTMSQPRSVTAVFNSASTADIQVTMTSSPNKVESGKPLAFTITVTNLGPAAFAPTLIDSLPGPLMLVSAISSQGSCGGTFLISCALGSIPSGSAATVTINVIPNAPGSFSNSASVNAGTTDPNPTNNSATVVVHSLPFFFPPISWMGGGVYAAKTVVATADGNVWTGDINNTKEILQWRASDMHLVRTFASEIVETLGTQPEPDFAITPDGTYIVYSTAATVGVYRTTDGSLIRSFGFGGAYWPSISDDGQTIAFMTSYYGPTVIGHVADGSTLNIPAFEGTSSISPDGRLIAVSNRNTGVEFYRTSDGSFIRSLNGGIGNNSAIPDRLVWSANSDLLMASNKFLMKVWRISDFFELRSIPLPGSAVHTATMSRDGTLVAYGGGSDPFGYCCSSPNAMVWRVDDGAQVTTIAGDMSDLGFVYGIAFSPDNRTLILGKGRGLTSWFVPEGAPSPYKTGNGNYYKAIAYSSAGNLIATAGWDTTVVIWDASTGSVLSTIDTGKGVGGSEATDISALAFSPDGSQIAATIEKTVGVWSVAGVKLASLTNYTQTVTAVAYSPDGSLLAAGSTLPELKLWSTHTWSTVRTLTGSGGAIRSVQFSPDGTVVLAGDDSGIARSWNASTGTYIRSYLANGQGSMRIQYSPDGAQIAAGWNNRVLIYQVATGTLSRDITAHTMSGTSVAWSPDGTRLISGNPDATVAVWDTVTWGQLAVYKVETALHVGGVVAVAYSPDNSQFAYARGDAVVVAVDSGSPPTGTSVTVTTNPIGLTIVVDSTTLTSPQTFRWAQGTTHTIGVPSPQTALGTRNLFLSWNDGETQSHTVVTPATSTTYTATFRSQYLLSPGVAPAPAGSVLLEPPSADNFYDAGTALQAIAKSNAGYSFSSWAGGASGSTNPALFTLNSPQTITANFLALPVTTITTVPAGLLLTVDGSTFTAPQTFIWTAGSSHTIAVGTPQGSQLVRYAFKAWDDAGAASHTITAPSFSKTYTATFDTQYPLVLTTSPTVGGAITATPGGTDGYYNTGTAVQLSAAANPAFQFANWSGDLQGTTNAQPILVDAPKSVTANFNGPPPPTVVISQAAGQADPSDTQPINFTATFSVDVTDFIGTDVVISGTAPFAGRTIVVTGSGTTYNVAISGMIGPGTVIATIPAGVATAVTTSLPNQASTSSDNIVTFTGAALKRVRGQTISQ